MSARWNSADLPTAAPPVARTPTTKGKTQPDPIEARRNELKPAFVESPAAPRTYLIGQHAVAIGGNLHAQQLPGRLRLVVTGPADEVLVAALLAAVTAHSPATPPPVTP